MLQESQGAKREGDNVTDALLRQQVTCGWVSQKPGCDLKGKIHPEKDVIRGGTTTLGCCQWMAGVLTETYNVR